MQDRHFNDSDLGQVHQAAVRAEELTGGFYCIPGREWPRFPYDISTLADAPGPDRHVFADVIRAIRPASTAAGRSEQQLYRIRLRDDEILSAVSDRDDLRLFPLLLYVLTHELIHVVRFESGSVAYETDDPEARGVEEERVHAITRKVLHPACDPALGRVMERCFCGGIPSATIRPSK